MHDRWCSDTVHTQLGGRWDPDGRIIGWPDGREAWFPRVCHPPARWLLRIFSICLVDVSKLEFMWNDTGFSFARPCCVPVSHSRHVGVAACLLLDAAGSPTSAVRRNFIGGLAEKSK